MELQQIDPTQPTFLQYLILLPQPSEIHIGKKNSRNSNIGFWMHTADYLITIWEASHVSAQPLRKIFAGGVT